MSTLRARYARIKRLSKACWRTTPASSVRPLLLKTVTAAALLPGRGVNTLVLVHRTELLQQWKERLQAFLGAGTSESRTIGGGKTRQASSILP